MIEETGFIQPVAMEADPTELFPGDTGQLELEARRVLVEILRSPYLSASAKPARWQALLAHQSTIESRLHDLFVTLVVDHTRGLAYKRQVRTTEDEFPILLRDKPFTRVETLLLVQLRNLRQRAQGEGEAETHVDAEELEELALSHLGAGETDIAARQREIRSAITRLEKEGFLSEQSGGRYRVTSLVEVVLSVAQLNALNEWLRNASAPGGADSVVSTSSTTDDDDDDEEQLP